MRINSISPVIYQSRKNQSFGARKDDRQKLTPELRDIFSDSTVPNIKKKVLWQLSEIEDFCEASKDTPRSDLLELSDKIIRSETNILEMALRGDIKIFSLRGDEYKIKELLSLARIAKQKRNPLSSGRHSLLDIIKALPIFQIEDIVQKLYKEDNIYPRNLILKKNGDTESVGEIETDNDLKKAINIYLTKSLANDSLKSGDSIIMFDDNIKGKKAHIFVQPNIPSDIIDDEITITPPELIPLFKKKSIQKSMYALSEMPYFYNLTKGMDAKEIEAMAVMDKITNGVLAKMLNGEITFDILSPFGKGEIELPIVNPKKIMLDKKLGVYTSEKFDEILAKDTPAVLICTILNLMKSNGIDDVASIFFLNTKNRFLVKVNWEKGQESKFTLLEFKQDSPVIKCIRDILDKAPFQKGIVVLKEPDKTD